MKAKQIKNLLKGLVNNYCDSIGDDKITNIIKNKTYITGGCIPSMLMNEYVNDFDFYFINESDANIVKKFYEARKINSKDKYKLKLVTENSINLDDKIQLIIKFAGEPETVIKNFDWAHIKSYYKYPDQLNLTDDVYKLIIEKELIYTGSKYPLSSLLRLRKFIKKGWFVSTKTMLYIMLEVVQAFHNPDKSYIEDINKIEDKSIIKYYTNTEFEYKFDVREILYHLNGVDPLTIQQELEDKLGKNLTIKEIINLIEEN